MEYRGLVEQCVKDHLIDARIEQVLFLLDESARQKVRSILETMLEVHRGSVSTEAKSVIIERLREELNKVIESESYITKPEPEPIKSTLKEKGGFVTTRTLAIFILGLLIGSIILIGYFQSIPRVTRTYYRTVHQTITRTATTTLTRGPLTTTTTTMTATLTVTISNQIDGGEFLLLDLSDYYNGRHSAYLKEFFGHEIVSFAGIPFKVKLSGLNTIETPVKGRKTIKISVLKKDIKSIYLLGYGTFIAEEFGHKNLYCDDINHFSIGLEYSNGQYEEAFPTDVVLNKKQWSDILRGEGSVYSFPALPVAYFHVYRVDVDPSRKLNYIYINDKYAGDAQYVIYAITLKMES